jgi:ParB-like chromosome segregation protein Spo0J
LIDGHLRVKAAQHLGLKDVPVILCDDLSDGDVRALRISINRLATLAEWDSDLLAKELKTLSADGVGLEALGFDDDALNKLGVNLQEDAVSAVIEGDETRVTAADKLLGYENSTVRQIVLILDVNEFSDIMQALDQIKKAKDLDTNTEAAIAAIKAYANTIS